MKQRHFYTQLFRGSSCSTSFYSTDNLPTTSNAFKECHVSRATGCVKWEYINCETVKETATPFKKMWYLIAFYVLTLNVRVDANGELARLVLSKVGSVC